MNDLVYISPSVIPSTSANLIHVLNQIFSLAKLHNYKSVYLFISSNLSDKFLLEYIKKNFNLENKKIIIKKIPNFYNLGNSFLITFYFILFLIEYKKNNLCIISRNLYSSYLLSIFKKSFLFETHQVETGVKSLIQRYIICQKKTKTIVISEALKFRLQKYTKIPIHVLHDAAPPDLEAITKTKKKKILRLVIKEPLSNSSKFLIYAGSFYPGRGVDLICKLAQVFPRYNFILIGGSEKQINDFKFCFPSKNLFFIGHKPYIEVLELIRAADILLMPYQTKVSIGIKNQDTALFMSPLKLFEYMSSGVPIISSDLPSIREILVNNHNGLLCKPNDLKSWVKAIKKLDKQELAKKISKNAYSIYKSKYNWKFRAYEISKLF
jgi:glycosyltransferase involved in cell wall biosynthesis